MKQSVVKIISTIFPTPVAAWAYSQLLNPQVKKLRDNELAVLDKAEKAIFKFKNFDIQLYTWRGGADSVLLIHGWEGQAGNFTDVVEQLIARNYTVYAFDAPSHGFSSKGQTSLFEFIELVGILIRKYSVRKLISHSFGGVATTYALYINPDLHIDKYLLFTVPDKFSERIDDVAAQAGITEKVKNKLIRRLAAETNLDIHSLNVSDFVKKINVAQALIIHDSNDTVIPIERAQNVAANWQNAQLVEITGTGHFRILRTPSVIAEGLAFLQD